MSNTPKIIKQFEQIDCPHCTKPIILGTQSMMSTVVSINKPEDVKLAKEKVIERLNEIKFKNDKDKESITQWLKEENTLIDGSDIESLLRQIAIEQLNENKDASTT